MQISLLAQLAPCNSSDLMTADTNVTSLGASSHSNEEYDHVGAMEFIVATLLVYCLLGIAGLLLLRIKRRATKNHRTVIMKEEHIEEYIKQAEELRLSGHRQKLRIETKKMISHIESLEKLKEEANSAIHEAELTPLFTDHNKTECQCQSRLPICNTGALLVTYADVTVTMAADIKYESTLDIPKSNRDLEPLDAVVSLNVETGREREDCHHKNRLMENRINTGADSCYSLESGNVKVTDSNTCTPSIHLKVLDTPDVRNFVNDSNNNTNNQKLVSIKRVHF